MSLSAQGGEESPLIAYVRSAFTILAQGAPQVAESLLKVATEGKSEKARVDASIAIMDRIGMHPRVDIGITGTHLIGVVEDDAPKVAVDTVRARLALLREQAGNPMPVEDNVVPFPTMIVAGEVEDEDGN